MMIIKLKYKNVRLNRLKESRQTFTSYLSFLNYSLCRQKRRVCLLWPCLPCKVVADLKPVVALKAVVVHGHRIDGHLKVVFDGSLAIV